MEKFYQDKGFANAKVTSSVGSLSSDWNNFNLTYTVFEGSIIKVASLEVISDIKELEAEAFLSAVSISAGDTYIGSKLDQIRKSIETKANYLGFPFAKVIIESQKTKDPLFLKVVFRIVNGPSLFVERIDIKGNNQTLDRVIRREFSISEGDAFNPILILSLIHI